MLGSVFSRLTYANVIATLALFIALGGTAAAGAHDWVTGASIRNGSVRGVDVANHSLTAKKLKLQTLTGAQVRDGSLHAVDFDPADLQKLVGPAGPAGAAGPAGPKGDEGKTGDPGEGILHVSASGADATNYVNDDVLISQALPADGGWLGWAQLDATNTSGSDDYFNCGLFVNGQQLGGGDDEAHQRRRLRPGRPGSTGRGVVRERRWRRHVQRHERRSEVRQDHVAGGASRSGWSSVTTTCSSSTRTA
jgi:hypothetical protein